MTIRIQRDEWQRDCGAEGQIRKTKNQLEQLENKSEEDGGTKAEEEVNKMRENQKDSVQKECHESRVSREKWNRSADSFVSHCLFGQRSLFIKEKH